MTQDDSASILLWREYLALLDLESRLKLEARLSDGLLNCDARQRQARLQALQIVNETFAPEAEFDASVLDTADTLYEP